MSYLLYKNLLALFNEDEYMWMTWTEYIIYRFLQLLLFLLKWTILGPFYLYSYVITTYRLLKQKIPLFSSYVLGLFILSPCVIIALITLEFSNNKIILDISNALIKYTIPNFLEIINKLSSYIMSSNTLFAISVAFIFIAYISISTFLIIGFVLLIIICHPVITLSFLGGDFIIKILMRIDNNCKQSHKRSSPK